MLSSWFSYFLIVASTMALCIGLAILVIIVKHRELPTIKASSVFFSVIIVIGISLAFDYLIVVGMEYTGCKWKSDEADECYEFFFKNSSPNSRLLV